MRKSTLILSILLGLIIIVDIVLLFMWNKSTKSLKAEYESTIESLQATIEMYGGEVTCYTVKKTVMPGDEITEEVLLPVTKLASNINEQYVTDPDSIIGKYFKIGVSNGTPLLTDMVMSEQIRDDMRDVDIYVDRWTVGLKEGDYIDVNITMPYGDDYYVLSHKRVMSIGDNTLKVYLTAGEWAVYQGALIDYYLNQEYGCVIYAQKYIEPGIQQEAVAFYTPPSNISALVQKNPNVIEKEELANVTSWRSSIEELLVIFRDEADTVDSDGSKLAAGRSGFNSAVMSDANSQKAIDEELEALEEAAEEDDWSDIPSSDGMTEDIQEAAEEVAVW